MTERLRSFYLMGVTKDHPRFCLMNKFGHNPWLSLGKCVYVSNEKKIIRLSLPII
jgi:hypothetical protein